MPRDQERLHLYIPSRSRAETICDGTLRWLPPSWYTKTTVVVIPEQYESYQQHIQSYLDQGMDLRVLSMAKEYTPAKVEIGQMAYDRGYPAFAFLDDDLRFNTRDLSKPGGLTMSTQDDMERMLSRVAELTQAYGAVGVSPREFYDKTLTKDEYLRNVRLVRFIAHPTELYCQLKHEGRGMRTMQDYDTLLQLLRQGYPNACLHTYAQDHRRTKNDLVTGVNLYRTEAIQRASAQQLARLHFPFVRVVEKVSRRKDPNSDWTSHNRYNVIVDWKGAYESSHYPPASIL